MNSKEFRESIQKQWPEKEIQKEIKEYLESKDYYVMRLNSGQYSLGEGRGFVKNQEPGTPDLMGFKKVLLGDGVNLAGSLIEAIDLLFIEVKRHGKKPTPLQEQGI